MESWRLPLFKQDRKQKKAAAPNEPQKYLEKAEGLGDDRVHDGDSQDDLAHIITVLGEAFSMIIQSDHSRFFKGSRSANATVPYDDRIMIGLLSYQLTQRLPFGDASGPMVPLRRLKGFEEFFSIQANRVAKGFEIVSPDLNLEAILGPSGNFRLKRTRHRVPPPNGSVIQYTPDERKSNYDRCPHHGLADLEVLSDEF
ncbi:MAG: hypothetical protein ACREIL_08715 [Nitrospiraceae bacterium]